MTDKAMKCLQAKEEYLHDLEVGKNLRAQKVLTRTKKIDT